MKGTNPANNVQRIANGEMKVTSSRQLQKPIPTPPNAALGASMGQNFASTLAQAQLTHTMLANPPTSRWSSLSFLATTHAPRNRFPFIRSQLQTPNATAPIISLPQTFSILKQTVPSSPVAAVQKPASVAHTVGLPLQPMALSQYPHPVGDNGRGIHWVPTISQSKEVVDRYVKDAVAMGMKWVVFLNEGANIGANDYLVQQLTKADIEPVMRVYTPGVVPVSGDVSSMVKHYTAMGVHYFQIYNEPNLRVETDGKPADVKQYVKLWGDVAEKVVAAGGLPGFGALSPQGEMDDREFLRQALQTLKDTGKLHLLDKGWLAMHNYTGPRPLNDPNGFLRFQQYNDVIQQSLGRSIPIIGTEGGTHISPLVSPKQQIDMVTGAYKYMMHREPFNFAYTYWIIANGHDPAWNSQALFKPDGPTRLAQALMDMTSGGKA